MANEGIRFAQSAIDRFIQFKLIQLQQQREDERGRRFDLSLQQNRRFNQERIGIAERQVAATEGSLAFRREQANLPTDISFEGLGEIDEFVESHISTDPGLKTSISPGATSVSRENIIASWNRFRDTFRATAEGINASPETIGLLRDSFLGNIQRRHKGAFRFGAGGGEFDVPGIDELELSGQQTAFPSRQGAEDLTQLSDEDLRNIIGPQ